MPKLKFTATHSFTCYHDKPKDWHDGDEQNVSDVRAEHMLADFPANFSVVGEPVTKAEPAPENKAEPPPEDKGIFRRRPGRPRKVK